MIVNHRSLSTRVGGKLILHLFLERQEHRLGDLVDSTTIFGFEHCNGSFLAPVNFTFCLLGVHFLEKAKNGFVFSDQWILQRKK